MKAILMVALFCGGVAAQDMTSCPMHPELTKSRHNADVEKHGDEAMGFPHDKTTHHFRLLPDGGSIEVTVNDAKDVDNLQSIRMHLKHITTMFAEGNFSIPMFVHSEIPSGVTEMKDRKGDIAYSFEELATGGRVRIVTRNRDALNAVHDFIIFQIQDHHTEDTTQP
jgi:hypothetical protein